MAYRHKPSIMIERSEVGTMMDLGLFELIGSNLQGEEREDWD